jgi:hypothetical protein
MNHVRICERLGVTFPGPTRQFRTHALQKLLVCAENNLNFGLFDFDMPVATKPDF